MDRIRIAVVGGGNRGISVTTNAIQRMEEFELVGYCERHPVRLRQVREATGLPEGRLYADFGRMLAECDFDALYVVTEPLKQTALCVQAMEAGKDVLCDVPVSYRLSDCWDLVLAAERTGRRFQMVEQLRYSTFVEEAARMRAAGEFGDVLYAEGQYIHNVAYTRTYWDEDRGVYCSEAEARGRPHCTREDRIPLHPIVYDPHEMSPLLRILGDRVATVTCLGTGLGSRVYPADDLIDLETALMRTEKGTVLRILNSFTLPYPAAPAHWYQILGTKASFETPRADWDAGRLWRKPDDYESFARRQDFERVGRDLWAPPIVTELAKHSSHFGLDYLPFQNYADAVLRGAAMQLDVYGAAEATAPGIVASISAEHEGTPFRVPGFRPGPERKAGEEPASRLARSVDGRIEREATLRVRDREAFHA